MIIPNTFNHFLDEFETRNEIDENCVEFVHYYHDDYELHTIDIENAMSSFFNTDVHSRILRNEAEEYCKAYDVAYMKERMVKFFIVTFRKFTFIKRVSIVIREI